MIQRKTKWPTMLLLGLVSVSSAVGFWQSPDKTLIATDPATAQESPEWSPSLEEMELLARANRAVARRAIPAVVHILTRGKPAPLFMHPFLPEIAPQDREEFERELREHIDEMGDENAEELLHRRPTRGQGSGVIIDADEGLILTNHHVAGEAEHIEVRLHDGRLFEARLIGSDRATDLAVIAIEATGLAELPLGDSSQLQVGDPVMTVGNPFGLEGTVSKGIVSAVNRSSGMILDYEGFIQTDAVINPGNSGGPLVNMRGEIVGINTAIETSTGSYDGVGFAIPSSRIQRVLPYLVKGEAVVRGYLGVSIASVRDFLGEARRLKWNEPTGVIIRGVLEGSPAESAGIHPDDILVSFNGEPLATSAQLQDSVAYSAPGAKILMEVWREGRMSSLNVEIGRQPEGFTTRPNSRQLPLLRPGDEDEEPGEPESDVASGSIDFSKWGLTVAGLTDQTRRSFDIGSGRTGGVVVTRVHPDTQADALQIRRGDVIESVNNQPVASLEDFQRLLHDNGADQAINLRLQSQGQSRQVRLYPVQ